MVRKLPGILLNHVDDKWLHELEAFAFMALGHGDITEVFGIQTMIILPDRVSQIVQVSGNRIARCLLVPMFRRPIAPLERLIER